MSCFANLSTGLRAQIAERKSYIEKMHINIKKLQDEIQTKQNTLIHYKANAKRYKKPLTGKWETWNNEIEPR